MEWRPQVPVSDLRQFTDEERLVYWDAYVEDLAEIFTQKDPPEVEFERWIRWDESGRVWGKCLSEEFGYDVVYDTFAGTFGDMEVLNGGDFSLVHERLAFFTCMARFPIDPVYMIPFTMEQTDEMMAMFEGWSPNTPDQIRVTYEFLDEVWLPCVRGEGLEAPELPDKQTFIDTFSHGYSFDPPFGADEACGLMQPSAAALFGY